MSRKINASARRDDKMTLKLGARTMPRYDEYDDDDFDDLRIERLRRRDTAPKSLSGLGMVSIGIGVLMFMVFPALFVLAAMLDDPNNAQPPDKDPAMMAVGLGLLLSLGFTLIGLVLGIIGCCQPDRSMVCGLLGAILNGLLLLGMIALVCTGLALGP
jgi:hypothetical protein